MAIVKASTPRSRYSARATNSSGRLPGIVYYSASDQIFNPIYNNRTSLDAVVNDESRINVNGFSNISLWQWFDRVGPAINYAWV